MNDKLSQSLKSRLSGMRWGEREQTATFRQIQRKEMQDVKHVKRGAGVLAIAMTLLFLVAGAAFAIGTMPQPEDATTLSQPSGAEFVPVTSRQFENDYLTLTVDSARWTGETASFEVTLRLKEPEKYAICIGSYHNPGSTWRTALPVTMDARWIDDKTEDFIVYESFSSYPEVVAMTEDSATVLFSCEWMDADHESEEIILTVASDDRFRDQFTFLLSREAQGAAQPTATPSPQPDENASRQRLWMMANDLFTTYSVESRIDGDKLHMTLEFVPKMPWYVINTTAQGYSTMTITPSFYAGYDGSTPLLHISVTPTFTHTGDSLLMSVVIPFPEEHSTITLSVHADAKDRITGAEHTSFFQQTSYRPGAYPSPTPGPQASAVPTVSPTATPAPQATRTVIPPPRTTPTPSPAPQRSEPTGEHIGGTEHVSVYLEDSWYDGFSAEYTLRIRADDAADRLAIVPNAGERPSESTWVIRLAGSWNDYYASVITPELSLEEATGDIIARILYYEDMQVSQGIPFSIPVTLSVINEKTWETETDDISLKAEISGEYPRQPLYLLSSTVEDAFLEAGYITTDRYHYIGVMRAFDNYYSGVTVTDAEGNVLGSSAGSFASRRSNQHLLFTDAPSDNTQVTIGVLRLDGSIPLPEVLHVQCHSERAPQLPLFVLTTAEPPVAALQPATSHQQVSIVLDKNVLFDNEYVTVVFEDADYGSGHAFAHLSTILKDPESYATVEHAASGATYLDMQLSFTGYGGAEPIAFAAVTESWDDADQQHFLHAYSPEWTAANPPAVFARLTLQSEDGSINEEYTAEFTFPTSGEVRLYGMVSTEEQQWGEDFQYITGQLADTDYLCAISLQYRCVEPYQQADISIKSNRTFEPDYSHDQLLSITDTSASLHQADLLYTYFYFHPTQPNDTFTLTAHDPEYGFTLGVIPFILVPIDD